MSGGPGKFGVKAGPDTVDTGSKRRARSRPNGDSRTRFARAHLINGCRSRVFLESPGRGIDNESTQPTRSQTSVRGVPVRNLHYGTHICRMVRNRSTLDTTGWRIHEFRRWSTMIVLNLVAKDALLRRQRRRRPRSRQRVCCGR